MCVCSVCRGVVHSVAQQKLQWSWGPDLEPHRKKAAGTAVSLNKPLIIQCHPLCKVGFHEPFHIMSLFYFAFVFCKFLSVPQGMWNLGILAPQQGSAPCPLHLASLGVLGTAPPGVPTVMSLLRAQLSRGHVVLSFKTPSASGICFSPRIAGPGPLLHCFSSGNLQSIIITFSLRCNVPIVKYMSSFSF